MKLILRITSVYEESSVFTPIPKKGNAKECSKYHKIALISDVSKVMLKILQARLNSTWTENFQMFKLDLEKAEEPEINCQHPLNHRKSKRITQKHLLHWLRQSFWLWITTNCGTFLKWWKHQTTLPASWEICMQVKKQPLEPDMEQQTGSKLGMEYD